MRMFELQNSTPNVYNRKRDSDGLASFTPHDIVCSVVCKCLIIEKAERPAFLLKFSFFNDLFSEPKFSRIIFASMP